MSQFTGIVSGSSIAKLLEMSLLMSYKTNGSFLFLPASGDAEQGKANKYLLLLVALGGPYFYSHLNVVPNAPLGFLVYFRQKRAYQWV